MIPSLRSLAHALILLAAVAAGCCTAPPRAEKFFDRTRSPSETVRMLRYAVEAKQYDVAYLCFTEDFREKHSATEVSLALRYGSLEGRRLRRLIIDAYQDPVVEPIAGLAIDEACWVTVVFFDRPPEEDPATDFWEQSLFLIRDPESREWLIDLDRVRGAMRGMVDDYSRRP